MESRIDTSRYCIFWVSNITLLVKLYVVAAI